MHRDDRSYIYFLKYTTKTKIYFRRFRISKKSFHGGIFSLILTIGLITLGFTGIINSHTFAQIETNDSSTAVVTARQPITNPKVSIAEYTSINYDRPASSKDSMVNGGGFAVPFRLIGDESEAEESRMETQLRMIEKTSNPAFLPTIWAHFGKINNEFGFRRNPFGGLSYEFHAGMDIGGEYGDAVIATANGIVTNADWQGGYGNMIEIDHGNGLTTRYGHLSRIGVNVGDVVQRGQFIGLIGSTGRSTGPHLHYELRLNDKSINPRRFLPSEPTKFGILSAN